MTGARSAAPPGPRGFPFTMMGPRVAAVSC